MAQIGLGYKLGALAAFSTAGFGLTAMLAVRMMSRLNALDAKLDGIANQLKDLEALLQGQQLAKLKAGLAMLQNFEHTHDGDDLKIATHDCTEATHAYGNVLREEISGKKRLPVLNQYSRYLVLAFSAQVRCLIISGQLSLAGQRIGEQMPNLTESAKTTFDQVLAKEPEAYFDPYLRADGVTLDLMSENLALPA